MQENFNKSEIIKQLNNPKTEFLNQLLLYWPKIPFKDIAKIFMKKKKKAIILWNNMEEIEKVSKEFIINYKKYKFQKITTEINNCIKSNNTKKLATILSKCFRITRKRFIGSPLLGIKKDNEIFLGEDAVKIKLDFYSNLFNQFGKGAGTKTDLNFNEIEFSENYWCEAMKKLSHHKACSVDEAPDELIENKRCKENVRNMIKIILQTGIIPPYWKYARLCLISKEPNNSFPEIKNTRPIVILTFLYKLLELYWAEACQGQIWKNIAAHQTGFRAHSSTHINISKLKQWIKKSEKGVILFVDIYKAYDHVIREKLYDLLSFIGVDYKYVLLYKIITTDMVIFIDENTTIQYNNGLPQGSCISPMLFNLYYDQALRTITPYSDLILAFADDLAIVKNEVTNLTKVIINLKKWKTDFNLNVNDSKTEIMLINMEKPIYINYAHCSKYKYLGTIIENCKEKLRKNSITKRIKETCNKLKGMYLKNCVAKVSKLSVTWWFISIILYHHISDVQCKFINTADLEHHLIISIKKILGIKKNVKHLFVIGYLGLNLQNTINNMLIKIYDNDKLKNKEPIGIVDRTRIRSSSSLAC